MKRLLLAGVAALLMAMSAHADWQCGDITVKLEKLTSDHLAELRISGFFVQEHKRFDFRFVGEDGAKLNGKRCRILTKD